MDICTTPLRVPIHRVSTLGTAASLLISAANNKDRKDLEQAAQLVQQVYESSDQPSGNVWRRVIHLALLIGATEQANDLPLTFEPNALLAKADRLLISPWTRGSVSYEQLERARNRFLEVTQKKTT